MSLPARVFSPTSLTPDRRPEVLTDSGGRIFAILAGQPLCKDPGEWQRVTEGASAALASFRDNGDRAGLFKAADHKHRRGRFLAVASGVSFGGGQKVTRCCSCSRP